MTLSVPRAGVSFLVGAADRDAALALLATIRWAYVDQPGFPHVLPTDLVDVSAEPRR